ncbi:hypothetical protein Q5752_001161 [Cryptotrichosporon argae]
MAYNGRPPFNGPPPSLPPFRPHFTPGQPPPGGFPPFPPNGNFVRPPFPPTLPQSASPQPNGFQSPAGFRPPAPPTPHHPPRPGIGLPQPPSGLPQPPRFVPAPSPAPSFTPSRPGSVPGYGPNAGQPRRDVKTTKIFIGNIAPGIRDDTLTALLDACGPLHELKRVEGAGGRQQPFGFASFENPEVVLRCIRCLNGVELPDLTPGSRNPPKALLVKADEKTSQFLKEFEDTVGRTDTDEDADAATRRAIAHIVALLTDPSAQPEQQRPQDAGRDGGNSPIRVVVPAHLQDLKEGDLPENQRVAVLDEIAVFRVQAAQREKEKKKRDDDAERQRAIELARGVGPAAPGYGYGTRAFNQGGQQQPHRQWGAPGPKPDSPAGQAQNRRDPQGYAEPVAFVRPETVAGKGESERTDEEDEEMRRAARLRERDLALRDRERRVEARERQRIENLNREAASRKQQADAEERNRRHMAEMLAEWDDDEKADRGRELFYSDRTEWRAQRQQRRAREHQDDVRDRHLEEEEIKAIERESEEFLQKQAAELAELEEKQRRAGLLTEDAAPIKLAIAPVAEAAAEVKPKAEAKPAPAPRPGVSFGDDEDEDEGAIKVKRTFVKLEYTGGTTELDEAEQRARRNAKLLEIRKALPTDKRGVFGARVDWAAVHEPRVRDKLQAYVNKKIADVMGELDEDLAEFVFEHIRERKGPEDLEEGLEPVLAEEAEQFAVQLWRQLLFESKAYAVGVETGTMQA